MVPFVTNNVEIENVYVFELGVTQSLLPLRCNNNGTLTVTVDDNSRFIL